MKKRCFTCLCLVLFSSCVEEIDNNLLNFSFEKDVLTKSSAYGNSISQYSAKPIADEPITVTGYTYAAIRAGLADVIINITEETSDAFQLSPGRYVVDHYRVTKDVILPSGAYGLKQASPDCGYDPYVGNGVKGYSPIQAGSTYSMQTNTTHFKSKDGVALDGIWRPHMPQYMKWVYASRYNPNLIDRVNVTTSNKHVAFTTIVGNSNKNKILIAYREGADHVSSDGIIVQIASYDYGKTWTDRKVIYTPTPGTDARDPQFLRLSDNTLICRFFETKQNKHVVKSIQSNDFGNTYKLPVTLPGSNASNWTGSAAARGNMLYLSNIIYSVSYDSKAAWLTKSVDSGNTWYYVSELKTGMNETSLGYENGKMFCVARQGDSEPSTYGVSNDMGKTWTWKNLNISGDAPSLTSYDNGYILTYRNKANALTTGYSIDLAFWKDGKITSTPVCLYSNLNMDIGYADVLTMDNSFLLSCYIPNVIRCYEFWYDIFQ